MSLKRLNLYLLLFIACIAGYIWLYYNVISFQNEGKPFSVCIIKKVTGYPCPSCGSTRSLISLIHGDVFKSLYINPFGIVLSLIMLVSPFWILFDLMTKRGSLHVFYSKTEKIIRNSKIALPLIIIVLINWIWNIIKEL